MQILKISTCVNGILQSIPNVKRMRFPNNVNGIHKESKCKNLKVSLISYIQCQSNGIFTIYNCQGLHRMASTVHYLIILGN